MPVPFQSDHLGLWLKQFDVAATMQLPCPREKQLRTAAARMISVECSNKGDAAASDGARAHRVQRNLGFSLGWWRRRILVSCVSADFVRPCGSDISRIFQRIFSGFFLKAFLVFIKIPGKSPAESPQCPERANVGSLPRNPRLSSTANPLRARIGAVWLTSYLPENTFIVFVAWCASQTSLSIEAAKF